jgi:hypothetical protein
LALNSRLQSTIDTNEKAEPIEIALLCATKDIDMLKAGANIALT